jgi:urease alpha subunit
VLLNGGDIMAITNTNDPEPTTTAVVTIRIPCGADGDLVTDAEERLSQAGGVGDVSIDELHSIEPQLSATVITVGITLRWTRPMTDAKARERLTEVPGLESIKRVG